MNAPAIRLALRSFAILIAVVAMLDPVWSSSAPALREVVAVNLTSTDSREIEVALRASASGWNVLSRTATGPRLPCGPEETCVLVADGTMDVDLPADLRRTPSLIEVKTAAEPNVSVRSASVSAAHMSSASIARVELIGQGMKGKRTALRVMDGAAVVGSTTVNWDDAGPLGTSGTVRTVGTDVSWWALSAGARTLRIEAVPAEGEATQIDNSIDVGVSVDDRRASVVVFDARPSWNSTFVRRALEDDARFAVDYRTRLAPALTAGTVNGRLDARVLDTAAVVVIGGPDALTAGDVTLLEQFVRVRGGTLVLLPERRETGEASRLFGGPWTEHLTPSPERVGPLQATEILRTNDVPIASTVLARSGSSASIVVAPSGNGRIVVSGAMDAWRYRDLDTGAFDRFWRSLAAEGAMAGEGLQLRFTRDLAASRSRSRFTLRDRRMQPGTTIDASAVWRCGGGAAHVARLWPSGMPGEFTGEIPVEGIGSCSVEATVADRQATATVAVAERPTRGMESTLASLASRVAGAGGVVTASDDVSPVTKAISSSAAPMSPVVTIHPMRAWWWMIPFAGCLSLEWWLRRRSGLR